MAGPVRNKPGGHEGHDTGGIWDQSEEGGETVHQPEHGIWTGARAMHRQSTIAPQRTGEVGTNVKRAGSAETDQEHQVLVA